MTWGLGKATHLLMGVINKNCQLHDVQGWGKYLYICIHICICLSSYLSVNSSGRVLQLPNPSRQTALATTVPSNHPELD